MTRNKSRKWTWTESADEVRYIQSVNPKCPGSAFNNDPDCFARYRDMQYKQALHSGWSEHAGQILGSSW